MPGPETYFVPLRFARNIIYALKHAPLRPAVMRRAGRKAHDPSTARRAGPAIRLIDITAD
jgi:hypothetical protein